MTLSSAAYIAIHIHTPWKPFISALVVAAIFSLMSLIANLDAEIILPAAVWAGSVSAVSTSDSTWFHVGVIDKIVAISLYAAMLAVAVFTLSRWVDILFQRLYYGAKGIFPLRLLEFLEYFADVDVLRQVGYSYQVKNPAVLRAITHEDFLPNKRDWR